MKKTVLFLMVSVAVIVLQCCSNKKEEIEITSNKTFDVNMQMPLAIAFVDGVIVASDFSDNNGMVKLFNVETGKELAQIVPKGGSNNEVWEVSDFEINETKRHTYLKVYDLTKRRIMAYDVDAILNGGDQNPSVSEIKSIDRYYSLRKLDKGYAALGLFENYKFELLDDSLRKVSTYGDYLPNKNGTDNKMINATANLGRSEVSPDKTLLVNITYAAGIVRFYDVTGSKLSHKKDFVVNPLNYKIEGNDYKNLGTMGFLSVTISDKYVYALYSGEKENFDKPTPLGCHVYKFDYSGNPLSIYRLDAPTHTIAVNRKGDVLYTLVDDEGYKLHCYNIE